MDYSHAVLIGRFQPFHRGHLAVVEHALSVAEQVTVIVGSANAAPNIRNPFTFEEREAMILGSLTKEQAQRLHIHGVRDYYYNENAWLADVQSKVAGYIQDGDSVALVGSYKDGSSYYLRLFPQWEFVSSPVKDLGSATDIREVLLGTPSPLDWEGKRTDPPKLNDIGGLVSSHTYGMIEEWVKTPLAGALTKQWESIAKYKAGWSSAPFPPVFVTADAIVTASGHVLVVKRKLNPGKGLFAIPGGFVRQNETVRNAALRELREETRIRLDKLVLDGAIVDEHVFDHPDRSLRGRTITHGFHIDLRDGHLPEVTAGDDAAEALWMPLMDVIRNEEKFFEDHVHIIEFFTRVGAQ